MFEMFYMPLDSDVKKKLLPDQEVSCSAGETISGLGKNVTFLIPSSI